MGLLGDREQAALGFGCPIEEGYTDKPGIKAIANRSVDRMPASLNGYRQGDNEYKRLANLSVLAVIGLLTGEAIPLVSETHKSKGLDFIPK